MKTLFGVAFFVSFLFQQSLSEVVNRTSDAVEEFKIHLAPVLPQNGDSNAQRTHVIKVTNGQFGFNDTVDPEIFILIGNELHWLKGTSIEKLGRLADFRKNAFNLFAHKRNSRETILIEAFHWENTLIVVAYTGKGNYNVYVVPLVREKAKRTSMLFPIQKLSGHGTPNAINFLKHEKDIYCLLASTSKEENRSELRLLKWSHSYFQIIETIMNKNHKIDLVLVNQMEQLIILIESSSSPDIESLVQIHTYRGINETENDLPTTGLTTKRLQDIYVPFALNDGGVFLYHDLSDGHLHLTLCNGFVLSAWANGLCEFYSWKQDDLDDTTIFQRLPKYSLLNELTSSGMAFESTETDSRFYEIMFAGNLMAVRNNDLVVVVNEGKSANELPSTRVEKPPKFQVFRCDSNNLLDIIFQKLLKDSSNAAQYQVMCMYHDDSGTNDGSINFVFRTQNVPIGKVSIAGDMNEESSPTNMNTNRHLKEMRRIKMMLTDLQHHLRGQQEEYLKPMQEKMLTLNKVVNASRILRNNSSQLPDEIFAERVELNAESTVKTVVLISRQQQTKTLSTLTQELKSIKETVQTQLNGRNLGLSNLSKRATMENRTWIGETLNVERLFVPKESDFWQGFIRKNRSENPFYYLNGRIKAENLIFHGKAPKSKPDSMKDFVRAEDPDEFRVQNMSYRSKIFVETINGVNWDQFIQSVYRKNQNTVINGDIILTEATTIRNLLTDDINDFPVNEFMTLHTDQFIDANIFITKIHVSDIVCNTLNDMPHFSSNVALIGQNNVIQSRVSIAKCKIDGHLRLSDHEGEKITQHIVGTRIEDLIQLYNGHVTIKGSLALHNVVVTNNEPLCAVDHSENNGVISNVIVDGAVFSLESVSKEYWMKSVDQTFDVVTFTKPIVTSQLFVDFLDTHPANQYFILSDKIASIANQLPLTVIFDAETKIIGHLFIEPNVETTLQKISVEAVRRFDTSRIVLDSPIEFKGRLIVDHIATHFSIDGLLRRSVLEKAAFTKPTQFTLFEKNARKEFRNTLFIGNDITIISETPANIQVTNFNEYISLIDHLKSIIRADRETSIVGDVVFEQAFEADDLHIGKFIDNDGRVNYQYDAFYDLNQMLHDIFKYRENSIEYIQVNGSVIFNYPTFTVGKLKIGSLNGLQLAHYLDLVVRADTKHSLAKTVEVGGQKTFDASVVAESMNIGTLDGTIQIGDWIDNSLRKQVKIKEPPQKITSPKWSIENIVAENVIVQGAINNVKIQGKKLQPADIIFLDENPKNAITIKSDIIFPKGIVIGEKGKLSASQTRPCEINSLFEPKLKLQHDAYEFVSVTGKVRTPKKDTFDPRQRGALSFLFANAVLTDTKQVFHRNVTFRNKDNAVTFARIGESKTRVPKINEIDLVDMLADAMLKSTPLPDDKKQNVIVRGTKKFTSGIECKGQQTTIANSLQATILNGVNVKQLNNSIIRKNADVIEINPPVKLNFLLPPKIEQLFIGENHTINKVPADDIFFVSSPVVDKNLPTIKFAKDGSTVERIHVANHLKIGLVNDMPLTYFIENRIRKFTVPNKLNDSASQLINGRLTFENLIVAGPETRIDQINDVPIADIVLSVSAEEQHISGFKEIVGDDVALYIEKPFHAWKINDNDVLALYSKTVFLNQNQTIDQLTISPPSHLETKGGVVVHTEFNEMNINVDTADFFAYEIENVDLKSTHFRRPKTNKRLNYIDVTSDFRIAFDAMDILELNNKSMLQSWITADSMQIISKSSVCPVQYHVQPIQWPSRTLIVRRSKIGARLLTLSLGNVFVVHIRTEYPRDTTYYHECNFHNLDHESSPRSVVYVNNNAIYISPSDTIESAHMFQEKASVYLVLHFHNKEILVLEHSSSNQFGAWKEVFKMPLPDGSKQLPIIFNVRLLAWDDNKILIVATSTTSVSSAPLEFVETSVRFFRFNGERKEFQTMGKIVGDYDIISGINVPIIATDNDLQPTYTHRSHLFLVLSKMHSKHVKILRAIQSNHQNVSMVTFELERKLKISDRVETISVFSEFDKTYLAIVESSGDLKVYEHRHYHQHVAESAALAKNHRWKLSISGFLKHSKAILPFSVNNKVYLFVLMDEKYVNSTGVTDLNGNIAKLLTLNYS